MPRFVFLRPVMAAVIAFLFVLLLLAAPVAADEPGKLSELWIDLSMGPPLIELFNQRAQPQDIARVEHISQLDLLSDVQVGQKLVVFKSAEDAIRLLPHIHEEIDIVGYNLEHGPANPMDEQENPVASIQRLREVTDEYDLALALGPDHRFALSDGVAMAPYADYFILQIQKVQTEPEAVYDFVVPLIEDIRRANPAIEVSVQIRTEGDVDDLLEMLEPIQSELDGISILTSVETVAVTEEILGDLRQEVVAPSQPAPLPRREYEASAESAATAVAPAGSVAPVEPQIASDVSARRPILNAVADEGVLTTPEANQRIGSTWLLVAIAIVVGFALGAGYFSYRSGAS